MMPSRGLTQAERAIGHSVFGVTVPLDRVFILDVDLGFAFTKAGWSLSRKQWIYQILWHEVFARGPTTPSQKATWVHELVHVWQGENGLFTHAYMAQSAAAQTLHGIEDIIKKGKLGDWGEHRSTAYRFTVRDIGKNWSDFNVEQQGDVVRSWYMTEPYRRDRGIDFGEGVGGGGASPHDPRFPYIRDVIRASDRHARYRPIEPVGGADRQIAQIQKVLVTLGYLDAKQADGIVGRGRSATLDAVREFQSRNGLNPDRDLGGPNSETRKKLALPLQRLVPAPGDRNPRAACCCSSGSRRAHRTPRERSGWSPRR